MSFRLPFAFLLAIFVSLGLFYLMHYMISQGGGDLQQVEDYSVVDFVRLKREEQTEVRKRVIPEKPPLPKKPPPPPQLSVAEEPDVAMPQLKMDMPKISARGVSGGPFMGAVTSGMGQGGGDAELIALVKIAPQYPREAAIKGLEGWVKVEFTVTELGTVTDVDVIEADPRRVFDRAAKRAILKWKFKPKIVDGKAVPRRAQQVLEFVLDPE
jgi:protein TonB